MDDVLKLMGLIYKAHKMIYGEELINRMKDVKLLFIASDISDKSRARLLKKCHFYDIDIIDKYSSDELSNSIGKENIKALGITDKGFKETILKKIK